VAELSPLRRRMIGDMTVPNLVAGDPAILRRTGRTADVRPRRNNQPRSAALSGMPRGHEGHRRPSPRRPMGLDPRHRRSGATLHEPGLDDPTDNLVSPPMPSRRQLEAVETTCALTASQPASHAAGARSRHKRTPLHCRSLGKTTMFASPGSYPKRRQSEAPDTKPIAASARTSPRLRSIRAHMVAAKAAGQCEGEIDCIRASASVPRVMATGPTPSNS
jgi:hypothetical protein